MFCTRKPATMPIVVGRLAAQTPSLFSVFSSMPEATTSGGAHAKHAVSPGDTYWKAGYFRVRMRFLMECFYSEERIIFFSN